MYIQFRSQPIPHSMIITYTVIPELCCFSLAHTSLNLSDGRGKIADLFLGLL